MPGLKADEITISLTRTSLGDAPQFVAISYVWANPNDTTNIQIVSSLESQGTRTQAPYPVTHNLLCSLGAL